MSIVAMQIGIPVRYLLHSLWHFFNAEKQKNSLKSAKFCFICILCKSASALKNFTHIFNFLISTSFNICYHSTLKTSSNDFRRVSASRPLPFRPRMPITIFRLRVLPAFLGMVCHWYPSPPRISSTGAFSPSTPSHLQLFRYQNLTGH